MRKLILATFAIICLLSLVFAGTASAETAAAKNSAADESYRIVKVYQMDGIVTIERGGSMITPYVGMNLKSGDTVKTGKDSHLYLKLDNDKYLLAEPNTAFTLELSGTAKDSKTKINLTTGSIVSRLDEKLSKDSSYEVKTSASTMAVRGTLVRTGYLPGPTGASSSSCTVFEGTANITAMFGQPAADMTDASGSDALQVAAGKTVSFASGADGYAALPLITEIDYSEYSLATLQFVARSTETGRTLLIPTEQLDALIVTKQAEEAKAKQQTQQQSSGNDPAPAPTPTPDPEDNTDKAQSVTPKSRGTAEKLP